jgi:hypothetical protein
MHEAKSAEQYDFDWKLIWLANKYGRVDGFAVHASSQRMHRVDAKVG